MTLGVPLQLSSAVEDNYLLVFSIIDVGTGLRLSYQKMLGLKTEAIRKKMKPSISQLF